DTPPVVAYHPSCHLLRGLGVDSQPKDLLRAAGVPFVSLEAECCGFGGLFAVEQPELSGALLERKLDAIETSGVQTVTGCDISCLLHIEGGLRKRGSSIRCAHLAEILAGRRGRK
ncbi:MAG: (Fe-S)-binding protein, partial [Anaerolineae bacterium]